LAINSIDQNQVSETQQWKIILKKAFPEPRKLAGVLK
jgi:hypothetical protein